MRWLGIGGMAKMVCTDMAVFAVQCPTSRYCGLDSRWEKADGLCRIYSVLPWDIEVGGSWNVSIRQGKIQRRILNGIVIAPECQGISYSSRSSKKDN